MRSIRSAFRFVVRLNWSVSNHGCKGTKFRRIVQDFFEKSYMFLIQSMAPLFVEPYLLFICYFGKSLIHKRLPTVSPSGYINPCKIIILPGSLDALPAVLYPGETGSA